MPKSDENQPPKLMELERLREAMAGEIARRQLVDKEAEKLTVRDLDLSLEAWGERLESAPRRVRAAIFFLTVKIPAPFGDTPLVPNIMVRHSVKVLQAWIKEIRSDDEPSTPVKAKDAAGMIEPSIKPKE